MIADRYRLEREVGRGGMGAVWLAEDDLLGRPVALKRVGHLPGSLGAPGGDTGIESGINAARAEREAQMAARLSHPHIVPIYSVGDRDGIVYIVMALVVGEPLGARLHRLGPMAPDEAREILRAVADALAAVLGDDPTGPAGS